MKHFLTPLGIFVGGNILLLVLVLLFPAIETTNQQMLADTASISGQWWGWSWVSSTGVVRLFIYMAAEGIILWQTGVALLDIRHGY